jgi:hypothetical protein
MAATCIALLVHAVDVSAIWLLSGAAALAVRARRAGRLCRRSVGAVATQCSCKRVQAMILQPNNSVIAVKGSAEMLWHRGKTVR